MPANHLILCCPLLLLTSIFPGITVFSSELALQIRWPKYWSFSISSFSKYSGLISFKIDWFDFLAVQETLNYLLQRHSSKAPILQHSAFFIVQLLHPYMTTGKTITLTRWSLTLSIVCPSICHELMGLDVMILFFWMLSFKPAFSLSSFIRINRLFSASSLYAIGGGGLVTKLCLTLVIQSTGAH